MALGSCFVPTGYTGPIPAPYTTVVFYVPATPTETTILTDGDDLVIGSTIGATWVDQGGTDTLDYSGFGQGITIDEVAGLVQDASGGFAHIVAIPGRGFEIYQGTAFDDVIVAAAGDAKELHGNAGNDTLVGGANAELLDGGAGIDTASYANSALGVTVDLQLILPQVSAGDANNDRLTGIENLTGSAHNDHLAGDAGDNVLTGGAGADQLEGRAGADTADYSASAAGVTVDLVLGTGADGDAEGDRLTGIENLTGSALADHLTGDAGANGLRGGAGDDILLGGAGADALDGGDGSDLAIYQGSSAAVTVDLLAHTASGGDADGDVLTSIENLHGSSFNDDLTGDAGANIIAGDLGDDSLDGGGGNDLLVGDDGLDSIQGGAGNDSIDGGMGNDILFGQAGDDAILGGAGDDQIAGDSGLGEDGNDIIEGGAGADAINGNDGIDTLSYAGSGAGVTVNLATGTGSGGDAQGDTFANFERVLGSAFADVLAGDAGGNTLSGGAGDDVLAGGGGADALDGGTGTDTADYSASAAGVTVDLSLGTGVGGDAEGDTLTGMENLTGSALADHLTGDAGVNTLLGGAGGDTLRGGAGADVLDGGDGSDFANYQGSLLAVNVDLLAHTASGGDADGDVLTSIENLYGSSNADHLTGDDARNIIGGELGDDTLVGNGGDDTLDGEAGNDNLNGGAGNDRLIGRDGDDVFHGGAGADAIDGGTGNDIVFGQEGDDSIIGGTGDDQFAGEEGNDFIEGGAGADAISGGTGIDTASYARSQVGVAVNLATGAASGGDAQGDTFSGIEQVMGSAHNDALTGDAGANTLWGLDGADVLTGGVGADTLKGGAGNDTFVYTSIADSTVALAGKDAILDFTTGDKIDLSAIDANGAGPGDTAFTFGAGDFTRDAGEIRIVAFANNRYGVYLETTGDKQPDAIINVYSDHALTAADFVL